MALQILGERDPAAPHCSPIPWQEGVLEHQSTPELQGWSLLPNWVLASWEITGAPPDWETLHHLRSCSLWDDAGQGCRRVVIPPNP